MKNLKPLVWLCAIGLVLAMITAAACKPAEDPKKAGVTDEPKRVQMVAGLDDPKPNDFGVITAAQWQAHWPDIYATYESNSNNSDNQPGYIAQHPFLENIYSGGGFAVMYNQARAHTFTLLDVNATTRPHPLANCLTCKTPEMTALVNKDGRDVVYALPFADVKVNEPVSCYNCHGNTPNDGVQVTHEYLKTALGPDAGKVDERMLVCGQCHNEYFFTAANKAVTLPWVGLDGMTPENMLAFENAIVTPAGFVVSGVTLSEPFVGHIDMINKYSGAYMLKVQHPELETVLGAGSLIADKTTMMGAKGFACSDCHMGDKTNAEGELYTSHFWQSPLKNTDLLKNVCSECHGADSANLVNTVDRIQKDTVKRLDVIGEKLADLHVKIGEAAANGASADLLAELRSGVRDAQWYYDFVFVENSYGAHNSALTKNLLDKAEGMVDALLAKV